MVTSTFKSVHKLACVRMPSFYTVCIRKLKSSVNKHFDFTFNVFLRVELSDMERSAPHSFAINLPDPKVQNDNKVTTLL